MDVKSFFSKILKGSKGLNIPYPVLDAFNNAFDNPLNTEWTNADDHYEAVFYKDELEHIACYQCSGDLISLKINLLLGAIPEPVNATLKDHGELMNAIAIHEQGQVKYELIVRDEKLIRYFLLVSSSGEVIEKEKL